MRDGILPERERGAAMTSAFFLFEFGSTSLKFHFKLKERSAVQRLKVPWEIGHEVFQTGYITRVSLERCIRDLQLFFRQFAPGSNPGECLAFATGVFREARNIVDFTHQVRLKAGLKLRVISGDQEAALLQALYLGKHPLEPAFVFDLGSGSIQWVHARARDKASRGSLPLGVIRLFRLGCDDRGEFLPEYAYYLAGEHLAGIPPLDGERVVGSGGTVKAICKVLGGCSVSREALAALRDRVRVDGLPPVLKPHRLPLFLPGVVLVERLLDELGAAELCYEDLSVGEALLSKVLPFYSHSAPPRPSEVLRLIRFSAILPSPGGLPSQGRLPPQENG